MNGVFSRLPRAGLLPLSYGRSFTGVLPLYLLFSCIPIDGGATTAVFLVFLDGFILCEHEEIGLHGHPSINQIIVRRIQAGLKCPRIINVAVGITFVLTALTHLLTPKWRCYRLWFFVILVCRAPNLWRYTKTPEVGNFFTLRLPLRTIQEKLQSNKVSGAQFLTFDLRVICFWRGRASQLASLG